MSDVSVQYEHLIRRVYTNIRALSSQPSYVQSDCDFFTSKVEQSPVLVDDTYRQIRNAPCDDRQVNDLRRCFRYLISWCHVRGKFMYRMYAFIVAVCARSNVTLYADNVYVNNVNG